MTRYNKMYNEANIEEIEGQETLDLGVEMNDGPTEEVEDKRIEEIVAPINPQHQYGKVSCAKLNVRTRNSCDSEVLGIVTKGMKLLIEPADDVFYKVCTETGLDGYCMKKFIIIE